MPLRITLPIFDFLMTFSGSSALADLFSECLSLRVLWSISGTLFLVLKSELKASSERISGGGEAMATSTLI